ncbi:MAG: DEAD/DEAH box helicase family protein [Solobacterium sp.]|nr:DEAD/DEAH box helicase family protein [Solobacterium sp.]
MQCPRCLNTDREYFYKGSRGWYCRRCISFGAAMLEEDSAPVSLSPVREGSEEYTLQYPLTEAQKKISGECARLIDETDVLLYCVCGAGKTELVVSSIAKMLGKKKKVCFAIPRRQVVLELRERLAQYFPKANVIAVCGGHTQVTDGDLIICTTHQLYRYYRAFDLLILDEPDAFPFFGNDTLHGIAETACRGHTVYLTATADDHLLRRVEEGSMACLRLTKRPHGHPLPVPRIEIASRAVLFLKMLDWLKAHNDHPRMVFVPTIKAAKIMHMIMHPLIPCYVCTSKTENRDQVIEEFRKETNGVIIATTVLERGVTVPGADICVFEADSGVFSEASLIQMAGRAGRSFQYPDGDVLFLCTQKKELVFLCRKTIREDNACAV